MIFLIDYDRSKGEIVTLRSFADSERRDVDDLRLALELRLNQEKIDREVVVLDAESEADLRRTHRRYFETLESLATTPRK